ncbi:hypothetical protein ACQPUR_03240 [Clostridium neonatale]|uniref:hypothetical protein n=1 Tax=Clostridium neonatale TaxID=137838 RepID=UPI003D341FCA
MRIEKEIYRVEEKIKEGYYRIEDKERNLKVWKLEELEQKEREYITKHINKANDLLRKISTPYSRGNFVYPNIFYVEISDSIYSNGSIFKRDNNMIELRINTSYLEKIYKRKYNKRLLETIMHELIHMYTNIIFDHNGVCKYSHDSSPIFCAIVMWFDKQFKGEYHIGLNGHLGRFFKLYQPQLYKKINDGISWDELIITLIDFKDKLEKQLSKYSKDYITKYSKQTEEQKTRGEKDILMKNLFICNFNGENETNSYCNVHYYGVIQGIKKIVLEENTVYLGLDANPYDDEVNNIRNQLDYILNETGELNEDGEPWECEDGRYYDSTSMDEPEILGQAS